MSASRRTFLKSTLTSAGVAWGRLKGMTALPVRDAADSPAEVSFANTHIFTRGVGVYPGDPREDFGPLLMLDETPYRNLAFRRPAVHSSSYDYNLTAQLVTDGIKESQLPQWVATSTSQHGTLKKNEREWLLQFRCDIN